jgi:RsmE family RNA methyltransferase
VVVGLVKGGQLDLVVQKLTELGVERVAPALCRRSVVAWDAARHVAAGQRLTAVAHAAAKQSRRALVPEVAPVARLAEQAAAAPPPRLVCWEEGDRPPAAAPSPCLRGSRTLREHSPRKVVEGAESAVLHSAHVPGGPPATLGGRLGGG